MLSVLIEFSFPSYLRAACRHGPRTAAHLSLLEPGATERHKSVRPSQPDVPVTTHSHGLNLALDTLEGGKG